MQLISGSNSLRNQETNTHICIYKYTFVVATQIKTIMDRRHIHTHTHTHVQFVADETMRAKQNAQMKTDETEKIWEKREKLNRDG